ncbi:ABC transporter [Paraoerskovia sediminicola]|uniref:ABC transporter n=1 Tax=Paraoerskovia sediminicola TaxID=1138587 RepID=A0ABN6XFF6_9CELL|nr:ABC transporter ATP-binding protein [Paraoerskovia sediminicola]BDZ42407.1 ABC transporter [Paraoerskovia sediminicola]
MSGQGTRDGAGLEVRDAVVRYAPSGRKGSRAAEPTTAVDGVNLTVAPGEVVALLGPSGCGKSSLLRAVAGLEPLAAGSVAWAGRPLAGVPVHRRGFGLMFQEGQLFAHRDVAGNVGYGLERGDAAVPASARAERVAELLGLVGLEGYARRGVTTLSGGERQRVALARSLAPRPGLLLLDEPLSALDRSLRERLAADLREVLVSTGTTGVFVTHDQDEAFTVADRVAVMDAGRLLQVATPEDLWARPASRTVAEFLGYQAFVPADGPDPLGVGSGDGDGGNDRGLAGTGGTAGAVLAVGPAGLLVSDDGTGPGGVPGEVVTSRLRRGRVEVTVLADLGEGRRRLTALLADPGTDAPDDGATVRLRLDPRGCAPVG